MLIKKPFKKGFGSACAPFYKVAAGGSPVTLDVKGTELRTANNVNSASYTNLTIGSGNGLIVVINYENKLISGTSVVWDSGGSNQAMTKLVSQVNNANSLVEIWGLRAPIAGNKTLAVSWTTLGQAMIAGISFNNVNQASDAAAFPVSSRVSGNPSGTTLPTLDVPSASGHQVVGIIGQNGNNLSAPTPGTFIFTDNAGAGGNGAAQFADGAATVTLGWTNDNAADNYAMAGVDVSN
jgi:hypothetical protein